MLWAPRSDRIAAPNKIAKRADEPRAVGRDKGVASASELNGYVAEERFRGDEFEGIARWLIAAACAHFAIRARLIDPRSLADRYPQERTAPASAQASGT